jgi:N-formylglutamate deformylase
MSPFEIHHEQAGRVPIVISIPHCGTEFPQELAPDYDQQLIAWPDDTDWYVNQLYDFAPAMGMKMIHAVYSRWVIDLNRDPANTPLYTDGRIITGLCPVTSFKGEPLYNDKRAEVNESEVKRRIDQYYSPYHHALLQLLEDTIQKFGKVLLWDCHSIRQFVPTIYDNKFPDLILGDNDGFAAGPFLTEIASKTLLSSGYSFENNFLFKGGYITRQYGQPELHQHALQLEMTKVNYMDDSETSYHPRRADKMRDNLKRMFEKLVTVMQL